ncbi:carbohydrate ABC transporter permease [Bacilli bacterium]|uniref:carbohydrate ABC transporter permease n=1 Tax=Oceanobacillus sp. FSL K6-0118 TaxID=2921418 RepID=UPI000621B2B2|nr:ABC transporter permease [Bacilli bacterium VT-13-104]PZD88009.1 carbohydrate ABC transporter permease [Bacilli bacterium]PZD90200.1 carbohydrate ABC transporter permease [Bacilli bacterium]PZD92094.1 carbohydrate ABC transporter permease [Bacilli bacterium]RCO06978.1 carbohydrate ABC transporter permease [Bacilli bacterium]
MIKQLRLIPMYLIAIVILIFTGLPFLVMINTSFKKQLEFMTAPWSLPEKFTLENYFLLIESNFFSYFLNSVIVTVISVVIVIIFAALASYPLARMKFKLNRPVYILFLIGMMIPIHTTLIPIFKLTQTIGLYDSIWALIGPYVAFALPVSIVIYTQFLQEIPKELEESAKIDGCGHFRLFWQILFPLLKPATATIAIYNFIHIWNEFIFALVLTNSPSNGTLPIGLREFYGEFSVNVPGIMAALTLGSLPLLLIYFVAQEKIVQGLAAGSVKG